MLLKLQHVYRSSGSLSHVDSHTVSLGLSSEMSSKTPEQWFSKCGPQRSSVSILRGNLLRMQISRPRLQPTEAGKWGVGSSHLAQQALQGILRHIQVGEPMPTEIIPLFLIGLPSSNFDLPRIQPLELWFSETLPGSSRGQTYIHNNTKTLPFPLFFP